MCYLKSLTLNTEQVGSRVCDQKRFVSWLNMKVHSNLVIFTEFGKGDYEVDDCAIVNSCCKENDQIQ